ncbi:MAG: hypothetical protein HY360_05355 [Verrucomicrobia bacterium]|nr:hypothetical protein [Verrucomicrobiota bacterium]
MALLTFTVNVHAATPKAPVFATESTTGGNMEYECQAATALVHGDQRVVGQALSERAVSRARTDQFRNEKGNPGNWLKVIPTGAADAAFAFPVNGAFSLNSSTLAVELRGRGWKAGSGSAETLVTMVGAAGNVTLLTDGQGRLTLRTKDKTTTVNPPTSFDGVHTFIVTMDKNTATFYWDGLPVGSGAASELAKVDKVIVGQVGAGPGENKDIIHVEIYDRVFSQAEVSHWHLDVGIQPAAHITLVKRQKPIRIDGVIEPEEWADAARITGLAKIEADGQYEVYGPAMLAADQSEFYVTYDDEFIYIAHHSPPPARIAGQTQLVVAMLKRTMDKHDDALVNDDHVKFTFLNSYPGGEEKKIYINGNSTTYEFLPLKWDPQIVRQSRLTDTGWWLEAAIAWKDLHIGPPRDGKTVFLNLVRGWRQEMDETHIWTFGRYDAATGKANALTGGGSASANPAGAVTLAGPEGIVVRLDEVGPLNRGVLDIAATVVNKTSKEAKLKAMLDSNSGTVKQVKELTLAAGARQNVHFTGAITDFVTSTVTLRVVEAASGTEYFAQGWPVRRRYEPEIYTRKFRSRDLIAFENNFEYLSEYPLKDLKADLTILNKATGQPVFTKSLAYNTYTPRDEVSTKDWAIGQYEVQYHFTAKGKKIGSVTAGYEHVVLPPWWNSNVGNWDYEQDDVPYPFTDLAINGTTLDCVGRRYHFGDSLLPHSIETQGRPLLRAPMTLKAVTAEGTTLSSDSAKCTRAEWTLKKKVRIEGVREIGNDALALRNELWAEYDGFIWCKLVIAPKAGKKVTLNSLTLDIPLTPEFTDVMNAYEYGLNNAGKVHPYTGTTVPLWLGNGGGGIQWLNETDGQLFVKDIKEVAHVLPGAGEGATMRIELINVPTDFETEHTIEFGFNATPTRPKIQRTMKDPDYWGMHGEVGGAWYPEGQPFQAGPDYGYRGGWRPGGVISPDKQFCYSGLRRCYVTTAAANVNDADGQNFGDEWLASAGTRVKGIVVTTQASKSYRDYFVWRHWNALTTQYPFQHWYFDTPNESPSSNESAGAGYVTRDGRRVAVKAVLGARNLCRRMYNLLIRWYPFAMVGYHTSGMLNTGYISFGTALIDGENFNTIIGPSQPTYVKALTPDRFRAQYMGFNICGNASIFMGQARQGWEEAKMMGGAENVMDHLQGLFLLHDNYPPGWIFGKNNSHVLDESGKRCWDAIEKHGLFSPFYDFVPYWEQKAVKPPFEEFYATFYTFRHQNIDKIKMPAATIFGDMTEEQKKNYRKAICIFYNHSDWEGTMRLKLNWQSLGFAGPQGVKAENAVHRTGFKVETTKNEKGEDVYKAVFFPRPDEFAKVEGQEVVFPMTKWNYRMIILEKEK